MRGAWAGEMGQTQFMARTIVATRSISTATDGATCPHSPADVLASTANFLKRTAGSAGLVGPRRTNAEVLKGWNKSQVYARTIAYLCIEACRQ